MPTDGKSASRKNVGWKSGNFSRFRENFEDFEELGGFGLDDDVDIEEKEEVKKKRLNIKAK